MQENRRTTLVPELFAPVEIASSESERLAGPSVGFWRDAWSRLVKNKGALISLFVLVSIGLLAFVIGPLLAPSGPAAQDLLTRFQAPSGSHWFGTDDFGRDMWARVWDGTQVSLYIGFLAAAVDLVVGVTYGMVSGLAGGRVDDIMQRIVEVLVGIPILVALILVVVAFGASVLTIAIGLTLTGWVGMARIVRGQVLRLKEQEFFLASRSLGARSSRLMRQHLLPNSLGPIIITLMLTVPSAIYAEAILSFIGLGIQPPAASLGALVDSGTDQLLYHPYLLFIPAVVVALIMLCFNLLADGLRDAFDPRMRR